MRSFEAGNPSERQAWEADGGNYSRTGSERDSWRSVQDSVAVRMRVERYHFLQCRWYSRWSTDTDQARSCRNRFAEWFVRMGRQMVRERNGEQDR